MASRLTSGRLPRERPHTAGGERVTQPVRGRHRLTTMSDESLLWTHTPVQRNRPRPGEALWSVEQGDVTWTAELFFHGEGIGVGGQDFPRRRAVDREDISPARCGRRVGQERTGSPREGRLLVVRVATERTGIPQPSDLLKAFWAKPARRGRDHAFCCSLWPAGVSESRSETDELYADRRHAPRVL